MRRFVIALTAASLAGLTLASAAEARLTRAQTVVLVKTAQKFRAADSDRSRQLSPAEFTTAGGNGEHFDAIDANDNGQLGFYEVLRAVFWRIRQR